MNKSSNHPIYPDTFLSEPTVTIICTYSVSDLRLLTEHNFWAIEESWACRRSRRSHNPKWCTPSWSGSPAPCEVFNFLQSEHIWDEHVGVTQTLVRFLNIFSRQKYKNHDHDCEGNKNKENKRKKNDSNMYKINKTRVLGWSSLFIPAASFGCHVAFVLSLTLFRLALMRLWGWGWWRLRTWNRGMKSHLTLRQMASLQPDPERDV